VIDNKKKISAQTNAMNYNMKTHREVEKNIEYLSSALKDSPDIIKREFIAARDTKAYLVCVDGLSDQALLQDSVLESLVQNVLISNIAPNPNKLLQNITAPTYSLVEDFNVIILLILSGDTALFIDGIDKAIIIASRGFVGRGVPETSTEIVVQGSKEAFSEGLRTNTSLIRRRIRDANLTLEQLNLGTKTKTDIALMYMQGAVNEAVLEKVKEDLKSFSIEAILDIGYIEEFIEKSPYSPFPTTQITERPDKAASAILEGRLVIICDNSPFALIIPTVFSSFFESSEDFYGRSITMSLSRLLRYLAFLISVTLPGLYLAIVLFNPNMIQPSLLFRMEQARREVPFPLFLEFFLMDTAFELLKEAGIRLPSAIGSTIGVVGGIIIGQAAIEAGLASPIVVIIVALVAICSFTIPSNQLSSVVRICKYILLFSSAFLGLFGFWIGFIFIIIHLSALKSFGEPYLYPFVGSNYKGILKALLRPALKSQ